MQSSGLLYTPRRYRTHGGVVGTFAQLCDNSKPATLCMKDRKYDKRHIWSKNHSGCLETSCHVRGPLRNKMAMLGVH